MSLLVAGMWGIPHVAQACSCLPPEPPQAAFEQAAAVFVGEAVAVAEVGGGDTLPRRRYEFQVKGFWKGDPPRRVALTSAASSAACGRSFEIGEAYLVYASAGPDGGLVDHLCSRTRPQASADEDLEVLGPRQVHDKEAPPPEPSDREPPRIEPPPPADPPATEPPPKQGCTVAAPPPVAVVLPLLVAARRRRRRRA